MKAQLFACVLLLVAILALTISQSNGRHTDVDDGFGIADTNSLIRSKTSSKRRPQCQRNIQRRCTSTTKTCGRLGRANICQAFPNDCQRQLANCGKNQSTKFFRKVNRSLCKGMAYDTLLPCGSGGS
ncbi:hypothetical protein KR054_004251, partial [Drosophila jambulina]